MAHKQKASKFKAGDILGMGPDGHLDHNSPWYAWFRVEKTEPEGIGLVRLSFSNGWSILRDLDDENIVADERDPDIVARFLAEAMRQVTA